MRTRLFFLILLTVVVATTTLRTAQAATGITAVYDPNTQTLQVTGDDLVNSIVVSNDAVGAIVVNDGTVPVIGGVITTGANTLNVIVRGGAGDDDLRMQPISGLLPPAQLFGGKGNDALLGSQAADLLVGDVGNDSARGALGADVVDLGPGNDSFQWFPGDSSDQVDGGTGVDQLLFDGANTAEVIGLAANGPRVSFTRNVAAISMDLGGMESVHYRALAGADSVTIGDLSATTMRSVSVDLASTTGPDATADQILVTGSDANNVLSLHGPTAPPTSSRLAVTVSGGDPTLDTVFVNTLGGKDRVDASGLTAGIAAVTMVGGTGNDNLTGSAGSDRFLWAPGDGNDVVRGGADIDSVQFAGNDASEQLRLARAGSCATFTRNIDAARSTMDDVEHVSYSATTGADLVDVGDMTGTDLQRVDLDFSGTPGSNVGDGVFDRVVVNGSAASDTLGTALVGTGYQVVGLPIIFAVAGVDSVVDAFGINGLDGDDTISTTNMQVPVTVDGGRGNDTLRAGRMTDLVRGGAGNDMFNWSPGDNSDTLEGGTGTDMLFFDGTVIAEVIRLSDVGGHVQLTRDIANVDLDLNDVEGITLRTRGGADSVLADDLSGTDLRTFDVDVNGVVGGDATSDLLVIEGSIAASNVTITGNGTVAAITGFRTNVSIASPDAMDAYWVYGEDGNDRLNAGGFAHEAGVLHLEGGDGKDVITGGNGDDFLFGNANDDSINGGDGFDTIDGGTGTDTVVNGEALTNVP